LEELEELGEGSSSELGEGSSSELEGVSSSELEEELEELEGGSTSELEEELEDLEEELEELSPPHLNSQYSRHSLLDPPSSL